MRAICFVVIAVCLLMVVQSPRGFHSYHASAISRQIQYLAKNQTGKETENILYLFLYKATVTVC